MCGGGLCCVVLSGEAEEKKALMWAESLSVMCCVISLFLSHSFSLCLLTSLVFFFSFSPTTTTKAGRE